MTWCKKNIVPGFSILGCIAVFIYVKVKEADSDFTGVKLKLLAPQVLTKFYKEEKWRIKRD